MYSRQAGRASGFGIRDSGQKPKDISYIIQKFQNLISTLIFLCFNLVRCAYFVFHRKYSANASTIGYEFFKVRLSRREAFFVSPKNRAMLLNVFVKKIVENILC